MQYASIQYARMQLWKYAIIQMCKYNYASMHAIIQVCMQLYKYVPCKYASVQVCKYAIKQYASILFASISYVSMQYAVYKICKYASLQYAVMHCASLQYASMQYASTGRFKKPHE